MFSDEFLATSAYFFSFDNAGNTALIFLALEVIVYFIIAASGGFKNFKVPILFFSPLVGCMLLFLIPGIVSVLVGLKPEIILKTHWQPYAFWGVYSVLSAILAVCVKLTDTPEEPNEYIILTMYYAGLAILSIYAVKSPVLNYLIIIQLAIPCIISYRLALQRNK